MGVDEWGRGGRGISGAQVEPICAKENFVTHEGHPLGEIMHTCEDM